MVFLNIAEDGRILSAQKMPETPVAVDTLPEGDISDYRYFDLAFLRDPLPKPPEPNTADADAPTTADKLEAQVTYTAMMTGTLLPGESEV